MCQLILPFITFISSYARVVGPNVGYSERLTKIIGKFWVIVLQSTSINKLDAECIELIRPQKT